jgi:hypothetical protein
MSSALFSDRELASGFWLAVFIVWALTRPTVRKSIKGVIRSFLHLKIVAPVGVLAAYLALVVLCLRPLGFWSTDLLKDTAYWYFGVGLASFFRLVKPGRGLLRSLVRDSVGIAVVLEFVVNLASFPLFLEALAVPLIALFAVMNVPAGHRPIDQRVVRLIGWVPALYGLAVLLYSISWGVRRPESVLSSDALLGFVLPFILTLAYLPFAYSLTLWARYEITLVRLRFFTKDDRLYKEARRRILMTFNLKLSALQRWADQRPSLMVKSRSDIERLLKPEPRPQPRGSAAILRTRLVPWTNPEGRELQMVLTDWKNTGQTPIRVVKADIASYDASGAPIDNGATDYPIFAAPDASPGVPPGAGYEAADDDGFVLVNAPGLWPRASTVDVRITGVWEESGM